MKLAAAILAGGEGRRIGGGKPLRIVGGDRLVDRALTQARQWTTTVGVCVRDPDQVPGLAAARILDAADIEGPLGGLAAAFGFATANECSLLLTLPCDMPLLPPDLAPRLIAALTPGNSVSLASSGSHLHPVCAVWRTQARDRLESYAATGKRSLRGFAEAVGCVSVHWPTDPIDRFFNVNTAADLDRAERLIAG